MGPDMRRRKFLGFIGGISATWPLSGRAQHAGKIYRLALLSGATGASRVPLIQALMGGMRELGYVEGKNLVTEQRNAEGTLERLPALARELIAWGPDVLFVSTTPAALAAKAMTSTLPVVFVSVADPLGVGLVTSLSRPGGNLTGITNIGAQLAGKRLEILKEIIPSASKIAVLINPDDQNSSSQMASAGSVAKKLAVGLEPILHVRNGAELKAAFEAAIGARAPGALRMLDPVALALRKPTISYAAQYRLPMMYPFREDVLEGGLVSYGADLPEQYRQAAASVHKIFRGAKPAEIPVEQPTKFQFAINSKTAKTLGLAIPPAVLARADEVIE